MCVKKIEKKRIALFHHYDAGNIVDDYVFYTLKMLQKQDIDIIFISMSNLSEKIIESLNTYILELYQVPNKGLDWNGWRTVLLKKGYAYFDKYDEILLINDSCYGPVVPLDVFFKKMDSKKCDFYGITKSDFSDYPLHIQSYFLGIRKSLFSCDIFWDFFRNMKIGDNYLNIVENCEINFSQTMYKNNFLSAAYCEYENSDVIVDLDHIEHFAFNAVPYLLRNYNLPFIKIKAFSSGIPRCADHFNKAADIINALHEIKSNYPMEYICNHLRRIKPASWQKNLPGTLIVLDPSIKEEKKNFDGKIAVFAHIFYEENINLLNNLNAIPYKYDLYISTVSDTMNKKIEIKLKNSNTLINNYYIKTIGNRGRDLGAWLTEFADKQLKYDYALKIKDKKSPTTFSGIAHDWKKFLDESLLYSRSYVAQLLNIFSQNKKVGLIFPTYTPVLMHIHGNFAGDIKNFEWMKNVLNKCLLPYVEENFIPVFPAGNEFWYRPKALEPLFSAGFTLKDFPPEPLPPDGTILHGIERAYAYIAQACGYEYRVVCPLPLLVETFQKYEDHMLRRHLFLNAHPGLPALLPPLRHQLMNLLRDKFPHLAKFMYPYLKLAYKIYKTATK